MQRNVITLAPRKRPDAPLTDPEIAEAIERLRAAMRGYLAVVAAKSISDELPGDLESVEDIWRDVQDEAQIHLVQKTQ